MKTYRVTIEETLFFSEVIRLAKDEEHLRKILQQDYPNKYWSFEEVVKMKDTVNSEKIDIIMNEINGSYKRKSFNTKRKMFIFKHLLQICRLPLDKKLYKIYSLKQLEEMFHEK